MPLKNAGLLGAAIGIALVMAPALAGAHSGATGVVKQRMDQMEDMAKSTKLLGDMVRGKVAFENNKAAAAATQIANHGKQMLDLFPPGSNPHPSEARPEIWDNWPEFERIANAMINAAEQLRLDANSAKSAMEIKDGFGDVASQCLACHKQFRLER